MVVEKDAKSYLFALVVEMFFSLRPVVVNPCTAKESRRVGETMHPHLANLSFLKKITTFGFFVCAKS